MNDLCGDIKERQRCAFEVPIWRIAQAQDELFQHCHRLPNGLWLKTVLTVDCFQDPWSWHCAVGLLRQIGQPGKAGQSAGELKQQMLQAEAVSLTTWSQAEYQLAIGSARALLEGVGQAQTVSWTAASIYQFTFQAWRDLSPEERLSVEAKMAEVPGIGGFQFSDRGKLSEQVMPATLTNH